MTPRLLSVVGILGAAAVLAVACAFPEVTYEPPSVEKESPQKSPHDAGAPCECEEEPPPATGSFEAGARIDPATCKDRPPCDCDDDGFAAIGCPKDPSTITGSKGPLQPGDCDDLDPRRFPGQAFRADLPENGLDGDWDCNGVVETGYPQNLVCGGTGEAGCTGGEAIAGTRPCGAKAHLSACMPSSDAQAPCIPIAIDYEIIQTCK